MDKRQKKALISLAGDNVVFGCPMARHTTFRVGGDVEALFEAHDVERLQRALAYLNGEHIPYLVVGGGSNLLVRDGGLEGVAILLKGSLQAVEQSGSDISTIIAGAGMTIVDLLKYCRESGLGGLEFLAGIPGTVGGAVAMNAGAFGEETATSIHEISMVVPGGGLVVRKRPQLKFSYRELLLEKGSVILKVCFKLALVDKEFVAERIARNLKRRKETQPLEYAGAGSIFKNPPNDYAGRLIEHMGLKGKRIGGAMISKKHANFIINTGGAKAGDILILLNLARDQVKNKTGIDLQPEIKVVGR